ncbi:carbohydrate ABC transporter permease [Paenibacillus sp. YN15]|uniref:carbohydrate ABC transporter permease n=1 Tax=Paenibacillus sp. YN15 TaxID=1742774 RepID=UPI000DCB4B4A|nr:carbohydrate ABC transporter permease [Paenibacillus sp. YN15]RAU98910.1 carbohydrate ABC transporter permease [Paenibacillus sp. YN15]
MKKKTTDYIFEGSIFILLAFLMVITLIPFLHLIAISFSADWAVVSGRVGVFPVDFQWETMKVVVTNATFLKAFMNSAFVTSVGTALSLILTAIVAYPLSKRSLPGLSVFMVLFIFTMMFNGGIIPNYLLIKNIGLLNNLFALILPSLLNVFNLLVIKSYYESIPEALEESAYIDGAGIMTILWRIIIPVSGPVLATMALFYAVAYWNDFFQAMLYINKPALKPLQLYLRDLVLMADDTSLMLSPEDRMNVPAEGLRAATVIAATLPIVVLYPLLQRHFVKGVMIGSVKG